MNNPNKSPYTPPYDEDQESSNWSMLQQFRDWQKKDEEIEDPIDDDQESVNWSLIDFSKIDKDKIPDKGKESENKEPEVVGTIVVLPGISKEAKFKELTGEDWPGVNYYAVQEEIPDDGWGHPIEKWVIYRKDTDKDDAPSDDSKVTPPKIDRLPIDHDGEDDDTPPNDGGNTPPSRPNGDPKENNKVEIGDINISKIEQEFAESKAERLRSLKESIDKLTPELAELYARNRRIFVGQKNRTEFTRAKREYQELLDEYNRLNGKETYEQGKHEIAEKLDVRIEELKSEIEEKLTEFAGGDLEESEKSQEEIDAEKERLIDEAEKTLRSEYGEMINALEGKVNVDFLNDFLKQASELEDVTIDKLDNGSPCRKFVNKVINNKILKGVLAAGAVVGLAATGIGLAAGLAAGTTAISFGFTAGGVAAGATRGGFMGTLMSRQNSEKSAVRGFANESEIREKLKDINLLEQDPGTTNVTEWLIGQQYDEANTTDRSSNRKRTLVSAGIGAALGTLTSGVHIDNVTQVTESHREVIGHEPIEYHPNSTDYQNVYHQSGTGAENYFVNETRLVSYDDFYKPGGFFDIYREVGTQHGLTVGESGWTYPGTLEDWATETSQEVVEEAVQRAVQQGIIPGYTTGGGPIYNTVSSVVDVVTPDLFRNFLVQATAFLGAGAIGGAIGGLGNRNRGERPPVTPPAGPAEPPVTPPSESGQSGGTDIEQLPVDHDGGDSEESAGGGESQFGTDPNLDEARRRAAASEQAADEAARVREALEQILGERERARAEVEEQARAEAEEQARAEATEQAGTEATEEPSFGEAERQQIAENMDLNRRRNEYRELIQNNPILNGPEGIQNDPNFGNGLEIMMDISDTRGQSRFSPAEIRDWFDSLSIGSQERIRTFLENNNGPQYARFGAQLRNLLGIPVNTQG